MVSPVDRPKKRLGQHFLKDPNTARIMAVVVEKSDVVLEVGPGRGFLTTFLAERAGFVHAVELDADVIPALRKTVAEHGDVAIHEGDALAFDYGTLDPQPNRLVANLPYNIASPLILKLLEEVVSIERLRFMVQIEVARRMAARRGTKDYAAYAVLVQLLAGVEVVHRISPRVFDPPPRVWSAVVDMLRKEPPEDYPHVKEFVVAAFRSRRKRLANNLPEPARSKAPAALESLGYGPDARAEEIRPEDFVALRKALSEEF